MSQRVIRIMMIDNDPAAHCYHKAMIEKAGLGRSIVNDYLEVDTALKAIQQAIQKGEADCLPDVILVDINMPNLDGWSFVDHLTNMEISEKFPKIFMVSNSLNPIDKIKVESSIFVQGFKQKFLDIHFFRSLTSLT